MALPVALDGHDVIGQAKTGTGKTLGFGIPLLSQLDAITDPEHHRRGAPQALVVVPTRELCVQVAEDLAQAGKRAHVKVLAIYGGRAFEPQIESLEKGVDVIVGTPGRLLDLSRRGHLKLSEVRILVLDEADEMLDMGFLPDVEAIVAQVPESRQTMLFSATMPGQIVSLARRYMTQPTHIRAVDPNEDNATVDTIEQHAWRAHAMDKVELLARILQAEGRGLTIVFIRTKRTCQKVADELNARGFAAGAVHGDLGQGAREQALRAFRKGKVDVLVATDVAARGIDIDDVTHVVNYSCPEDEKVYLHRVGRTGRAGKSGVAVTLVDWDDVARWQMINRALGLPFQHPVETYSTSEHVYTGLGIPRTARGVLPKDQQVREGLQAEEVEDLGETGKHGGHSNSQRDDRRGDSRRRSGGGSRNGRSGGGQAKSRDTSKDGDKPSARKPRKRRRTRGGQETKPSGDS
ncbi:MAG: DEAD/DEAH box helicase [Actinobacteria bacterium]|nr:MAG: DEAD/DEAH box helicase [Actinomycetota bacterium]